MRCMRKHVNRLHGNYPIGAIKHLKVTGLCGRVATDIYNAVGRSVQNGLHNIWVHTGTRRVGDDDVGPTMFIDKLLIEHIFHITGKEQGVVNVVDLRINFRIFDGFGNVFYAYHLVGLSSHEISNGTCARVEIIDKRSHPFPLQREE